MTTLTHLPHNHASHASLHHALSFKLCSENLLAVPRSAVVDGTVSYGGSTGLGMQLPCKAYGEFFERNYFFTSVPVHAHKTLSEINPPSYRQKLHSLCRKQDDARFAEHRFAVTEVKNLFDDTVYDYFYNSLSLDGSKADAPFFKFQRQLRLCFSSLKRQGIAWIFDGVSGTSSLAWQLDDKNLPLCHSSRSFKTHLSV